MAGRGGRSVAITGIATDGLRWPPFNPAPAILRDEDPRSDSEAPPARVAGDELDADGLVWANRQLGAVDDAVPANRPQSRTLPARGASPSERLRQAKQGAQRHDGRPPPRQRAPVHGMRASLNTGCGSAVECGVVHVRWGRRSGSGAAPDRKAHRALVAADQAAKPGQPRASAAQPPAAQSAAAARPSRRSEERRDGSAPTDERSAGSGRRARCRTIATNRTRSVAGGDEAGSAGDGVVSMAGTVRACPVSAHRHPVPTSARRLRPPVEPARADPSVESPASPAGQLLRRRPAGTDPSNYRRR